VVSASRWYADAADWKAACHFELSELFAEYLALDPSTDRGYDHLVRRRLYADASVVAETAADPALVGRAWNIAAALAEALGPHGLAMAQHLMQHKMGRLGDLKSEQRNAARRGWVTR
jgi:hypothetical protein